MSAPPYIGRFAPSPTGPMHFGTLIAAVASYLQARHNNGRWLLRMEDVDELRTVKNADTQILHSLETFGFGWDGDVLYQTSRIDAYQEALQRLRRQSLVYPCTCSRKQLARETGRWSPVYPGTCRNKTDWSIDDYAIRIRTADKTIVFDDVLCGTQQQNLADEVGDFVIRRRDGLFAYQLAVVVDDDWQGVTQVVRGTDLLDSTGRQIYLQQQLCLDTPGYLHFPVAVDASANKLSKSSHAAAIDESDPITTLNATLRFLGQREIDADGLDSFWKQAIADWDVTALPRRQTICIES